MVRLAKISLGLFLTGLLGLAGLSVWSYASTTSLAQPVLFEIAKGSSLVEIAAQGRDRHLFNCALCFRWLVRLTVGAAHLRAGEYEMLPGMTPWQVVQRFYRGEVTQYTLTLVEGWDLRQVRAAFDKHPALQHDLSGLTDAEWAAQLGLWQATPEGQLLAETYRFPKGTSDCTLLKRAHHSLEQTLARAWNTRDPDLPYNSPFEALIAASLIEKETATAAERPKVAAVIKQRLQRNMRLQIDPTVLYAVAGMSGHVITQNDLQFDSPYNTYRHRGLPPTPIALVGSESLFAALHPASEPWLYFVAQPGGGHTFSTTLQQHREAVQRYRASLVTLPAAGSQK